MAQAFVFDDKGDQWDAMSFGLAETLHASIAGDDLLGYVVRNMGFVGVAEADGSVRIKLRPELVSPLAFSALLYWLHDRPIKRALLSLLDGEWTHELLRSREEVVQRLIARIPFRADDRAGDFLQEKRPLRVLSSTSPLRALLDLWAECDGKFDRERVDAVLEHALDRRYVLVEAPADSQSVYFRDVGTGLTKLAGFWHTHRTNLRVEDQPDYAYGKWVSGLYREVIASGEPSLDEIDAILTWPDRRRESFRYRRLVVPFTGKNDSSLAVSATVIDLDINLRRKSG